MSERSIEVGAVGAATLTVQQSDTAEALSLSPGDSFLPVFATSRMIALMELAAARVLQTALQEGELSVGVSLNVRHTAATLVGSSVTAKATYLRPEGKLFSFRVEAFDEGGMIGEGEHVRAIVSIERLMAGAARRKS